MVVVMGVAVVCVRGEAGWVDSTLRVSFPTPSLTLWPGTFMGALPGVMTSYATVACCVIQQRAHAYHKPHASMQLALSAALSLGVGLASRVSR